MGLAGSILHTIRRHDMLPRGGRVLCALSGGADSVALLHVLLVSGQRRTVVAGVGHYNHGLRGADADGDEDFCRALARTLGLPFEAGRGDIREMARSQKRSIEDAGRAARYEFLAQAASRLGAVAVAVAHTVDDQAETFLLRLMRGAGTRGLGIRPRAGLLVRPLLEVRRADLGPTRQSGSWRARGRHEPGPAIPRNRVRHELIPYLERISLRHRRGAGPRAASAQEDEEKLHAEAIEMVASIVLTNEPTRSDAEALSGLHPALAACRPGSPAEARGSRHRVRSRQAVPRVRERRSDGFGGLPGPSRLASLEVAHRGVWSN